jgi:hypothetical protein
MHSFENVCGNNLQNEKAGWGSSYQRKRVSRIIQLLTNLDSRVRGNDEPNNAPPFHLRTWA